MAEPGVVTRPDEVRFERLLPGPIERVWHHLTDPDARGTWLAGGPMELRPGGTVLLRFRHADLSPVREVVPPRYAKYEDGDVLEGHVTRCEPPRRLAFTWGEGRDVPSEVSFELQPEGDRVRLLLTHRRLDGRDEMLSVASGWHTHLDILAEVLEGRDPAPFWSAHARHEAHYEERL